MSEKGLLYLVATPIGNLQDLSGRMKDAFSDCDLIACEDTRITRKILAHLDVHKPLISYREENERKQSKFLSSEISNGKKIVLVSDAGYPGISDPGFSIVRECRSQGLKIIPIPGPNAAITALAASGLPTHNFLFLGFPPKGRVAFGNLLEKWKDFEGSLIFYQSKYKMPFTYEVLEGIFGGDRFMCVAREITKIHESFIVGTISEVSGKSKDTSGKGEFTIVVAPEGFAL